MPGPGVRADDRPERGDDLDLRAAAAPRARVRSSAAARSGAAAWAIPSRSVGTSTVAALEHGDELLERLPAAAHALERHDLAPLEGEDRLDVEQRPGEGGATSDAPAAGKVLERLDGEEQAVRAAVALDQRVELLVARAPLEPPLHRESEHRDRRRDGAGVDHPHDVAAERRGRRLRARERPRERRGDL